MAKLIPAVICLFLTIPCQARVITVDDDETADFNNIQAAIDDSNDGDTIIVADGTYTGDGNRDIDFGGRAITVSSENGPNNCIIDCEGTYEDNHRGFYFHSGEDVNSVVEGFTITNGHGFVEPGPYPSWYLGGAIYCISSGPTIKNCVITANKATQGGGIFAWGNSSPTIINCTISENTLRGGIYCWGKTTAKIINARPA